MQKDTWMQHRVTVNAHTEWNSRANQALRLNAASYQTFHCNKSTAQCTASAAAEAKEELSTSLLVKQDLRILPHCLLPEAVMGKDSASWSHSRAEDLTVAVPFTHTDHQARRNSPLWDKKSSGDVFAFPQKHRGLLSASNLGPLPPAWLQNDSNAPDLWFSSTQGFLWSL